jgi:hypothetical protein
MAAGLHWEWRGFGAVSGAFTRQYCPLEPCFDPQNVEDIYLWIPGMQVNAKFLYPRPFFEMWGRYNVVRA